MLIKNILQKGLVANAHNLVYLVNLYLLGCLIDNNMKTPVTKVVSATRFLYKKAE